jgi:hypothetical protein
VAPDVDPAGLEARLFDGAVSCELMARVGLESGPVPHGAAEAAERLLQELAALEDRRAEGDESGHGGDPALRRLEAKLDLALQMLAQALPGLSRLDLQPVRLGPRGIRLAEPDALRDASGVLVWQPSEAFPLRVHLPVKALDGPRPARYWAFEPLPPGLQDALERHIFRLHRRWLAAQRRG